MTLSSNHLSTEISKIQAGVRLGDARIIARDFLRGFVESPILDADLILGRSCGLSRLEILTNPSHLLRENEAQKAQEMFLRRAQMEPIAYILGEKEFFGLNFRVNPDVLVPRPDTELLVEEAIKVIGQNKSTVIDVCTGSGCVAIALAHYSKFSHVIASDISEKALALAQINANQLGVTSQIEFRCGNLLITCDKEQNVDLIVSNPPYIPPSDMETLMKDVRDFEPRLALVGEGQDGLGLHRKILLQSYEILKYGGTLIMEIGDGQAEILSKEAYPGFSSPEFLRDYAGIFRVVKYNRLPSEEKLEKEGVFNG